MADPTKCPKCSAENIYFDGSLWTCPDCSHEWVATEETGAGESTQSGPRIVTDAHGTPLKDGDSISVIKDLKVKGSSSVVKVGTKVKNIRIIEDDNGHDISCKIEGFGAMNLKSEFVKKA